MNRFSKVLRLSQGERRLHFSALYLLMLTRIGLWLISFRSLQKFLAKFSTPAAESFSSEQIVIAIKRASRFVPRATCLVQALAAETLFCRQGEVVLLKIGVANGMRSVEAHAWIEKDGNVVLGDTMDLQRYRPLAAFERGKRVSELGSLSSPQSR